MLELSFRYLYKAYKMYSLDIYSKAVIHNGIYDIAFPKQPETQNIVMVNKLLDIYSLLYFRGSLRSLAALLDRCLLIDVLLFYKIVCCLKRHIFSNY